MHRATADARVAWPAEVAVLLACARPHLAANDRTTLEAAADRGVDWYRVLELARRHRVIPLLHRHASRGALVMPAAAASELAQRAMTNARRMLELSGELAQLLAHCARKGVEAVPLKGPVLAEQLYQSVAMRQAGDLDVLVRHADVPAVTELLRSRGYDIEQRASPELTAIARRDLHHVIATEPRRKLRVELHYWLLRPRGRKTHDLDALAPYLRPLQFMGQRTLALEGEALLAYLCEHGAEHSWSRIEWVATVAELLQRGIGDADGARPSLAATLGTTKRIAAARHLVGTLFDAPGAPGAAGRLTAAATHIVVRRLQHEPARVDESSSERFRYLLLTDSTASAALRRCRTMLLAPGIGDAEAVPLPGALAPLRWAIRPLRLLARRVLPHSS